MDKMQKVRQWEAKQIDAEKNSHLALFAIKKELAAQRYRKGYVAVEGEPLGTPEPTKLPRKRPSLFSIKKELAQTELENI